LLDEADEEADMKKISILFATAAALFVLAVAAPADAAARKAQGVTAGQSVQLDLSARRYYRRHVRHYYYRPRARIYYYRRPYYYAYPYYYAPRYYYYPYGYYYYRRPGIFFGFSF
jgi:hypothetical protein